MNAYYLVASLLICLLTIALLNDCKNSQFLLVDVRLRILMFSLCCSGLRVGD